SSATHLLGDGLPRITQEDAALAPTGVVPTGSGLPAEHGPDGRRTARPATGVGAAPTPQHGQQVDDLAAEVAGHDVRRLGNDRWPPRGVERGPDRPLWIVE